MDSADKLRIYEIVSDVRSLGPGIRFSIWVQGCPFDCSGCITPDAIDSNGGKIRLVKDICDQISNNNEIDGVTISGGEPFSQPGAVAEILNHSWSCGLGTIVFSGYKLRKLKQLAKNSSDVKRCLKHIDVLIDGLYVEPLNNGLEMKGSSNQKIHYLTERYSSNKKYFESYNRNKFEVMESNEGNEMYVGVPSRAVADTWSIMSRISYKETIK